MPVGGVQDPHRRPASLRTGCRRRTMPSRRRPAPTTANGSAALHDRAQRRRWAPGRPRPAGSPRPGTGTRRTAAPGSPAGRRTSCPGLASRARWRCAGGRKPYSGRAASAGSSRPTTRIAELATIRRSTSLAVCCAPIRITPSERPRSAMSSSTSLIGLEPSRGAYLFSSSSTTNSSGLAVPAFSLRSNSVLQRHADHEPLRPVGQVVQVDHGDLGALGGVDAVRPAGGAGRRGSAGPGPSCWRSAGGGRR